MPSRDYRIEFFDWNGNSTDTLKFEADDDALAKAHAEVLLIARDETCSRFRDGTLMRGGTMVFASTRTHKVTAHLRRA